MSNSSAQISTDASDYVPGSNVTIFGAGFIASAGINLTITNPDASIVNLTTSSNSTGEFATIYSQDDLLGTYSINATDGASYATTNFTVSSNPTITMSPSSGPVGSSVNVSGSGYAALSTIKIKFAAVLQTTNPQTITTDSLGNFNANFTIPSATLGSHPVRGYRCLGRHEGGSVQCHCVRHFECFYYNRPVELLAQ